MSKMHAAVVIVAGLWLLSGASDARSQNQPTAEPRAMDTVRAVIDSDGTIRYYTPARPEKGIKRQQPYAPAIDLSAFPSQQVDTFKVFSPTTGQVAGYWVGGKPEGVMAVGPGWQLENRGTIDVAQVQHLGMQGWVQSLSTDAMAKLSSQLMENAKQLACNERFRPEDVAVSASIGVVEVAMTWKTANLCK